MYAVVYMAQQKSNEPIASHDIAEASNKVKEQRIPERFLLKVLKPLVTHRVLKSIKGPNGGYQLARAAADITMLDVIEAVDGDIHGYAPSEKGSTTLNNKLETICNQSAEAVRKTLESVLISELVGRKDRDGASSSEESRPTRRRTARAAQ